MSIFTVELLPARHGDAIWIEYGDKTHPHRILIDGGATLPTYRALADRIRERVKPEDDVDFELIVLTHIDADHITGLLALFEDTTIKLRPGDVWFNAWKHLPTDLLGAVQAERLSDAIEHRKLPWNAEFGGKAVVLKGKLGTPPKLIPPIVLTGGMTLTLLSPTYDTLAQLAPVWKKEVEKAGLVPGEAPAAPGQGDLLGDAKPVPADLGDLVKAPFTGDGSEANAASIAFLAEYKKRSILLTGDAHSDVLQASIEQLVKKRRVTRLKVDAVKLPHHGSKYNLSPELLKLLDCKRFLVSTDGTSSSRHPDPTALARIVTKQDGAKLEFNYDTVTTSPWARTPLQDRYHFTTRYPEDEKVPGLLVEFDV